MEKDMLSQIVMIMVLVGNLKNAASVKQQDEMIMLLFTVCYMYMCIYFIFLFFYFSIN